jgi:hypothetical protein
VTLGGGPVFVQQMKGDLIYCRFFFSHIFKSKLKIILQCSQYITYVSDTALINKLTTIRSIIVVFIKFYNETSCRTGRWKL